MNGTRSNVVLVGMPGSGKSTVGVLLAKRMALGFVDTDLSIQTATGRSLQDIVDTDGYLALRAAEEKVLLQLRCRDHVIATGGSAVYSQAAMAHLKRDGLVVFLDLDLPTIRRRIGDFSGRGLAKRPDQTLEDLFRERSELYAREADEKVDCRGLNHEQVCEAVRGAWTRRRKESES